MNDRPLSIVGLRRKRCPITLTRTAWVQFLPAPTHETCLFCSAESLLMKLACLAIHAGLAERYCLMDPLRFTPRSARCSLCTGHLCQPLSKRRGYIINLYIVYLDFANAFNSVDQEALWWWLRELNVPDVEVSCSRCIVSRPWWPIWPYGQSSSIPLTRGTKQGEKLSPLLFDLIFNCRSKRRE